MKDDKKVVWCGVRERGNLIWRVVPIQKRPACFKFRAQSRRSSAPINCSDAVSRSTFKKLLDTYRPFLDFHAYNPMRTDWQRVQACLVLGGALICCCCSNVVQAGIIPHYIVVVRFIYVRCWLKEDNLTVGWYLFFGKTISAISQPRWLLAWSQHIWCIFKPMLKNWWGRWKPFAALITNNEPRTTSKPMKTTNRAKTTNERFHLRIYCGINWPNPWGDCHWHCGSYLVVSRDCFAQSIGNQLRSLVNWLVSLRSFFGLELNVTVLRQISIIYVFTLIWVNTFIRKTT